MKKLLVCMLLICLFAGGSVRYQPPQSNDIKDVGKSVDAFTAKLDRLQVSTEKLNKALK
ncbi:hypothetical protein ACFSJU_14770 [Paradesertivirga mongoliensis]|uniref:Uncharacterized protein n=1 Tax=Paradesertivirga mongoliensis TaxID=2100740 RepID=A0ABW4ZP18_9SPHI|nr:hypothetical protein [Pedobacter mongoliensis]